jgi:hypothetical protein
MIFLSARNLACRVCVGIGTQLERCSEDRLGTTILGTLGHEAVANKTRRTLKEYGLRVSANNAGYWRTYQQ